MSAIRSLRRRRPAVPSKVDGCSEFGRGLYWEIGGFVAAQNTVNIGRRQSEYFVLVGRIGHEAAGGDNRFGSKADILASNCDVCLTPGSGHLAGIDPSPLCANSAHRRSYSITSSARAKTAGARGRSSAFAVFRLITNSNLLACSTGRSAGFAPLRTRTTKSPAWR
jgi:hypothetical protein